MHSSVLTQHPEAAREGRRGAPLLRLPHCQANVHEAGGSGGLTCFAASKVVVGKRLGQCVARVANDCQVIPSELC